MNMTVHQSSTSAPVVLHPWLPQTFDQLLKFSECLANSHLVPMEYRGKPDACLVALQFGASMGIHPMQALQNIAVINGRPSLYGDAVLALVRASPLCVRVTEKFEGNTAICIVQRRGEPPQQRTFSEDDAICAGLWHKKGPWQDFPRRMLQMRARSFALRDVFPDVLFGMGVAEEVQDYVEWDDSVTDDEIQEVTPEPVAAKVSKPVKTKASKPVKTKVSKPVTAKVIETPVLPEYPKEKLEQFFPKWKALIESGKQTASNIITMIHSKNQYRLSDSQQAQIMAVKTPKTTVVENVETPVITKED